LISEDLGQGKVCSLTVRKKGYSRFGKVPPRAQGDLLPTHTKRKKRSEIVEEKPCAQRLLSLTGERRPVIPKRSEGEEEFPEGGELPAGKSGGNVEGDVREKNNRQEQ